MRLKKQAATREFKPVPLGLHGVDGDQEHAAHNRFAETSWRSSKEATRS